MSDTGRTLSPDCDDPEHYVLEGGGCLDCHEHSCRCDECMALNASEMESQR